MLTSMNNVGKLLAKFEMAWGVLTGVVLIGVGLYFLNENRKNKDKKKRNFGVILISLAGILTFMNYSYYSRLMKGKKGVGTRNVERRVIQDIF